jgi:hypothetical protein
MILRCSLVLVLLSGFLQAQTHDGPNVRLLAERTLPAHGKVTVTSGGKTSPALDLPIHYLSAPVELSERSFAVTSAGDSTVLATFTLPPKGRSFIALLIPKSEAAYLPILIPADDESFKPGDVYFYNLAPKTILGQVGSSKFSINPSSSKTVRLQGARPEKYYDVAFGVKEEVGNRVLSTTRWPLDERVRGYVFFYLNPAKKRIEYRMVSEFVPI